MCVFVVREHRVLALVNNMYMLEGKTKCLHLLHLCVERRVDRVIALIICVLGKRRPRTCNHLYYMCICGKGSPSACTMYVLCMGKGDRLLALVNIMCECVWEGVLLLAPINSTCIIGNGTGSHYNCVSKGRPRSCRY